MGRQAVVVLYVLALVAVVIGVDVLLFRHQFWERLMVNVGIVLVFAAFYLRFLVPEGFMSAAAAALRSTRRAGDPPPGGSTGARTWRASAPP
ncbi:hypothetical protein [Streptomyces sp. WM6378]|uniref:hypothetical protein n=1 Tax=Streptomyces sp. WM6378 TaxID=1415557 RepID=UPI0006AE8A1D|nr:hypothetical protein [Streptomyces sp. WM6378]KOU49456.1 hypothetical protein ADK54_10460 [Streptomyces sp. WM6378]